MKKQRQKGRTVAQVEAEARRLGVSYGQLSAPPVEVRGYAGPLAESAAGFLRTKEKPEKEAERCVICGEPLTGRQKRFCGEGCRNRYFCRQNRLRAAERARAAAAATGIAEAPGRKKGGRPWKAAS